MEDLIFLDGQLQRRHYVIKEYKKVVPKCKMTKYFKTLSVRTEWMRMDF